MVGRVSSPRFVSRLDELGVLAAALARAQAGDGSLVLVSGDSGVGKSRLIAEAGFRARAAGAAMVTGECPDLAKGELPYAPIVGRCDRWPGSGGTGSSARCSVLST